MKQGRTHNLANNAKPTFLFTLEEKLKKKKKYLRPVLILFWNKIFNKMYHLAPLKGHGKLTYRSKHRAWFSTG